MPQITDWIMVGITAIYVFATIAICWANFITAKATRQQITESKRQFDETSRLQVIPIFQISIDIDAEAPYSEMCKDELTFTLFSQEKEMLCRESYFTLSIENVGAGTAKDPLGVNRITIVSSFFSFFIVFHPHRKDIQGKNKYFKKM